MADSNATGCAGKSRPSPGTGLTDGSSVSGRSCRGRCGRGSWFYLTASVAANNGGCVALRLGRLFHEFGYPIGSTETQRLIQNTASGFAFGLECHLFFFSQLCLFAPLLTPGF